MTRANTKLLSYPKKTNRGKTTFSLENALSTIVENRSADRVRLLTASEKSQTYLTAQTKAENDFVDLLLKYFPDKYSQMLSRDEEGNVKVWSLVSDSAPGAKSQKLRLINEMMVDFHMNVRNSRDSSKYWEPSTTNSWNRRLLAHLSDKYGVNVAINDFSFQGGFPAVLHTLYAARAALNQDYGTGKNRKLLVDCDADIYKRAVTTLDRNDPKQLIMLILIFNGLYFGLRGQDHANLQVKHLAHGNFEEGHEYGEYKWVGLTNFDDKSHKLSVHQSYLRDHAHTMRLPIITDHPTSPGTIYWDYIKNRLSPG